MQVNCFDEPDLLQRLHDAKLSVPSVVKPQVTCGVADAQVIDPLWYMSLDYVIVEKTHKRNLDFHKLFSFIFVTNTTFYP